MNLSSSRRDFLRHSAVAGMGVVSGSLTDSAPAEQSAKSASKPASQPIVDTHQHLWDYSKFQPPWLKGVPKLNHSTTMKDYYKATSGLNVVKTVYMEVDVAPEQQGEEAEWVIEVCRKHNTPMVAGVISGRPAVPEFGDTMRRFKGSPYIKGVRHLLQGSDAPKGHCLQPQYVKNIQLLGELGLRFDICMRQGELSDGVQLVDACPDTRFVLDHCGNATARNPNQAQWERDISEFGQRKNVVCKVSGVIASVQPGWDASKELEPIVLHVIKSFGIDRVMFGGDWPVCNLTSSFRGWVEALRSIVHDMKPEDQRKLFHDNAMRFYGLT